MKDESCPHPTTEALVASLQKPGGAATSGSRLARSNGGAYALVVWLRHNPG